MTRKQFRRMKVFALRMTNVAIGNRWRKVVRDHVEAVIDCRMEWCMDKIIDWDNGVFDPEYRRYWEGGGDIVSNYLWDHNLEREKERRDGSVEVVDTGIGIAVSCCVRAAMDMATEPSGGVLGFTVGDLRKMWNRSTLPKWVTDFFEVDISTAPDTAGVWL